MEFNQIKFASWHFSVEPTTAAPAVAEIDAAGVVRIVDREGALAGGEWGRTQAREWAAAVLAGNASDIAAHAKDYLLIARIAELEAQVERMHQANVHSGLELSPGDWERLTLEPRERGSEMLFSINEIGLDGSVGRRA